MARNVPPRWGHARRASIKMRSGVESILASLFQKILYETAIGPTGLTRNIVQYLNVSSRRQNIKDLSSARGNLTKELTSGTMTWKVFVKALTVLNVLKFKVTVTLHHTNGNITVHDIDVNLGQHAGADEGDQDPDE